MELRVVAFFLRLEIPRSSYCIVTSLKATQASNIQTQRIVFFVWNRFQTLETNLLPAFFKKGYLLNGSVNRVSKITIFLGFKKGTDEGAVSPKRVPVFSSDVGPGGRSEFGLATF